MGVGKVDLLSKKIIAYLCGLGFVNYRKHYIYGAQERLHWEKINNFNTINAIFNTRSGHIYIGDNCVIGHNCSFLTGRHFFENGKLKQPRDKQVPLEGYDIHIGEGCWIASNVTILGGVTIGDNCLVCAGAVVTKKFNSQAVIAGIPAKKIGNTTLINAH
jgi:acetyltransferase-like isoleucine patch superfamily enzyme